MRDHGAEQVTVEFWKAKSVRANPRGLVVPAIPRLGTETTNLHGITPTGMGTRKGNRFPKRAVPSLDLEPLRVQRLAKHEAKPAETARFAGVVSTT